MKRVMKMQEWKTDKRRDVAIIDIDALVPKEHLVRKIERVMDYDWLYERLAPYYCEDNGRPGTDPVVLIKMVLLQHLFGIPSLRQTRREIEVNIAYRWFLGYSLLDNIPHFATVSYAFCKRFPTELAAEIFEHILNKAINNKMVDPSAVFIDGTHIKASANKKKLQKEQVAKTAKVYEDQLRAEINAERETLGKKPIEDRCDDDENGGQPPVETSEKAVSTTDPDCGMFVKGEHERQFAYEAHTACDSHGIVLGVEVTAGNIHDSVAFDSVYDSVTERFPEAEFIVMDAGYKTPWIAKKVLEDSRIPILPYTRSHTKKDGFKPWDYTYDEANDQIICPRGEILRHTTTDKTGKRTYRSCPKSCVNCPCREKCGANEKGQKLIQRHIWQEYLDLVEQLRKTERGRALYDKRKETIERVFADAKEKHAMRYTQHRGLARVDSWVRLKFACMNLKKLAIWSWRDPTFLRFFLAYCHIYAENPAAA
jgi:transposase